MSRRPSPSDVPSDLDPGPEDLCYDPAEEIPEPPGRWWEDESDPHLARAKAEAEARQAAKETRIDVDPMLENLSTLADLAAAKLTQKRGSNVVQLPLWPAPMRAAPNSVLRGALFAAIQGKQRKAFKTRTELASIGGISVAGFGIQLDQADLDTWQMALHLAREQPLGSRLEFSAKAFLKACDRNTGKTDREWLRHSLDRLQGFSIEVKQKGLAYVGSLIDDFAVDERTGRYSLSINPRLRALFDGGWTRLDFEQRRALIGKPLAQWLSAFYATHAAPHPMKVQTLHDLSGSANKSIRSFRRQLRIALDEIKALGAILDWKIDEADRVHVTRVVSPSQGRHLAGRKRGTDESE